MLSTTISRTAARMALLLLIATISLASTVQARAVSMGSGLDERDPAGCPENYVPDGYVPEGWKWGCVALIVLTGSGVAAACATTCGLGFLIANV